MMHKVLLADDHLIVKEGLKMILETSGKYLVVSEVSHGDQIAEEVLRVTPDLIISDLKMPGISIIESCGGIKEALPHIKIMIFTAFDESEDIYRAIHAGIDGYIKKDTHPQQILNTIDMVMLGYSCFQPKLDKKALKEDSRIYLTEREQEIFRCIVDNLSNQEIAKKLCISEATVKTHVSSILRKMGQPNRSQAVLFALKEGLVQI
jgi:DNA-binding NarL/FixJ family response regulator